MMSRPGERRAINKILEPSYNQLVSCFNCARTGARV